MAWTQPVPIVLGVADACALSALLLAAETPHLMNVALQVQIRADVDLKGFITVQILTTFECRCELVKFVIPLAVNSEQFSRCSNSNLLVKTSSDHWGWTKFEAPPHKYTIMFTLQNRSVLYKNFMRF